MLAERNSATKGGNIARCPFCNHILSDEWLKREGASLMGKARSGAAKARSHEVAKAAAQVRWDRERRKRERKKE